ncbi:MAG: hypothetical protein R2867_05835 [Caldilineaceae bacterium]
MTLDQGLIVGLGLLLVSLIIGGLIGALLSALPNLFGKALITGIGWVLGVGMLAEYATQIIQPWFGRGVVRQLFASKAILPTPAVYVFIVAVIVGLIWNWQRDSVVYRLWQPGHRIPTCCAHRWPGGVDGLSLGAAVGAWHISQRGDG